MMAPELEAEAEFKSGRPLAGIGAFWDAFLKANSKDPNWAALEPIICKALETAEKPLLAQVNWFRDAVAVLGFDAPAGDAVNPLKERLTELLAAERASKDLLAEASRLKLRIRRLAGKKRRAR